MRVERCRFPGTWAAVMLLTLGMMRRLEAHQLDEYLQATLIDLAPEGVVIELTLSPGVQVASQVLGLVDQNHDGRVSDAEGRYYIGKMAGDLELKLDDHLFELKLQTVRCSTVPEMLEGTGGIHAVFHTAPPQLTSGPHRLSYHNHHLPAISQYLVNLLISDPPWYTVVGQRRDEFQRQFEVDFEVKGTAPNRMLPTGAVAPPKSPLQSGWRVLAIAAAALGGIFGIRKLFFVR